MPAINIPSLNVNAIGEGLKDSKNYEMILDTLQRYRKELNFYLMNLDLDNMPSVGGLIGDLQGDYSLISQTVDGIVLSVGNIQGAVSALQIQATGILASVSDAEGNIAALQLTASGLQTQITDNTGNISTLTQTVDGISTLVYSPTDGLGAAWSAISQNATEISSVVSFTDVTGNEIVSKVNQTATTFSIDASKINLTGLTTIYSPINSNTYARIGGNYADFEIRSTGNPFFELYDTIGGISISLMGSEVITRHSAVGVTTAKGSWDFSSATVTGLGTATMKWA